MDLPATGICDIALSHSFRAVLHYHLSSSKNPAVDRVEPISTFPDSWTECHWSIPYQKEYVTVLNCIVLCRVGNCPAPEVERAHNDDIQDGMILRQLIR